MVGVGYFRSPELSTKESFKQIRIFGPGLSHGLDERTLWTLMGLPEYPLQFQNLVAGVRSGPSVSDNIRFQDRGEVGERMQASMFNVCVPLDETGQGGDVFLMNTFTDAQLIVSRDVADLLDRVGEGNVPETDEQREALATLAEHGFIVGDREGERVKLEKYFRNIREGHEQLRVTVLTTLQCNFACDYCFQGDHGDYNKFAAKMTLETAARVVDWAKGRLDALRPQTFVLTLFGGEPLLNLPVAYYLAEQLWNASVERGVRMHVNVITNGLLLTPEVVDRLAPYGLNAVKVTLDGDHDTHNRMRPLRGGQGTFDKIIENVRSGRWEMPHLDRRQLRRNLRRELSGAPRFPPRTGVRRQAGARGVQAGHPRAAAAAAQGHDPVDGGGRLRQAAEWHLHDVGGRRHQHLRQLQLPRRKDVVSARGNQEARVLDRRWRAHGTVRDPS